MKKIIFAVASVLALGLFASCQREISGDLTVNQHNTDSSVTKTLYYTVSGSLTETSKTSSYSKVAGASEVLNSTSETVDVYNIKDNAVGIELTETTNPLNNKVTYTFAIPAMKGERTITTVNYAGGTVTSTNVTKSLVTKGGFGFDVEKVDGKYYYQNSKREWVEIAGFNPRAAELDFSKFVDTAAETVNYPNGVTYKSETSGTTTADTVIDAYTLKTVDSSIKAFALKLAKK